MEGAFGEASPSRILSKTPDAIASHRALSAELTICRAKPATSSGPSRATTVATLLASLGDTAQLDRITDAGLCHGAARLLHTTHRVAHGALTTGRRARPGRRSSRWPRGLRLGRLPAPRLAGHSWWS